MQLNRRDIERWGKGFTRLVLLGVFVLLASSQAFAQNATPQPIDPKTIFAPNVEIVETLPVLTYDNTLSLVWYFDPTASKWASYPYPADLDKILDFQLRSDNTYLLSNEFYKGIVGAIWKNVWVFDPKGGLIKRAEAVCNLVKSLPGEGQWLFTQLPDDGLYRLCNNETGQISQPLPTNVQNKIQKVCTNDLYFSHGLPSSSPDGKWVVFNTCDLKGFPRYSIYAYNTETGITNHLGGEVSDYFELTKWADNQHILIRTGATQTSGNRDIYIANVERPQSYIEITSQYAFEPTILDQPLRILWITSEWPDANDSTKVTKLINEYDISTGQTTVIARHPCNNITCEAGYIVWADNQLVVFMNGYPLNIDYQASIRDLKTGEELYSASSKNSIVLQPNTFLFTIFDSAVHDCILQEVSIHENGVKTVNLQDSIVRCDGSASTFKNLNLAPDKQSLFITNDYNAQSLAVYNLDERKRYTVVEDLDDNYELLAQWRGENLIQIDVTKPEEQCGYYTCIVGSWLVRVSEKNN